MYKVPVYPAYGTTIVSGNELVRRLLDLERMTAKLSYDEALLAYKTGIIGDEEIAEFSAQRVKACGVYIAKWVGYAVENAFYGLTQEATPESIHSIMMMTANVALQKLASNHPDPTLAYIAQYGEWSVKLREGVVEVAWKSLPDIAPVAPEV
jgi:hypothetical protein